MKHTVEIAFMCGGSLEVAQGNDKVRFTTAKYGFTPGIINFHLWCNLRDYDLTVMKF